MGIIKEDTRSLDYSSYAKTAAKKPEYSQHRHSGGPGNIIFIVRTSSLKGLGFRV